MADFKKNPDKPFEVRVPNKIRKRIAMHEHKASNFFQRESPFLLPSAVAAKPKKRGSMWSRFTDRIKKFLR